MSAIVINRRHQFTLEEARGLVTDLARSLERDLDASWQWKGDELRFERTGAAGRVQLTGDCVNVEVTLGLVLRPLRSTIVAQINRRLDEILGPA